MNLICRHCGRIVNNPDDGPYFPFCSRGHQKSYLVKNGLYRVCSICGVDSCEQINFDKHHIDYLQDKTILVCKKCHGKIHHSKEKEFNKYLPKYNKEAALEIKTEIRIKKEKDELEHFWKEYRLKYGCNTRPAKILDRYY